MKHTPLFPLLLMALLWVLVLSPTPSAAANQGVVLLSQPSTFPIVISKPGSYRLTSDIVVPPDVSGIEINSGDVTLDLNGFTVRGAVSCTGSGASLNCTGGNPNFDIGGISSTKNNVTVRNGTVQGFNNGVALTGGAARIEDINAAENPGVGLEVGSGVITGCNAHRNGYGIITGFGTQVKDSTANFNAILGVQLQASGATETTAIMNGSVGFYGDGVSLVSNSTALFNGSADFSQVVSPKNNSCSGGPC